jgi:hypothetical protein
LYMGQMHLQHQPTLRQLLNSEAFAEAQVVFGDHLLNRPVIQVVASLTPPPRPGSILVARSENLLNGREPLMLKDLAALVLIKPAGSEGVSTAIPSALTAASQQLANAAGAAVAPINLDLSVKRILKMCTDAEVPMISMPSFGEPGQVADDVRMAFLREIKHANSRLHGQLLGMLLEQGLETFVESVSNELNRPVAVETADFKVIASQNMGGTPANQQRTLSVEVQSAL